MATLNPFIPAKRVVVKIGSALLVTPDTGQLKTDWLRALCQDLAKYRAHGIEFVLVSSGAIALGRARLGLLGRNLSLPEKQACAAAGQSMLTQGYEKALAEHNIITAQALLTLTDTENRRRWLNARQALETLLSLGAVPVINENDTVATEEIRYGDNDRLAARTAQMIGADTLILLSDIDGLYTSDPRICSDAQHLPVIDRITPEIIAMGGAPNAAANVGTGGMATKLAAAQIAARAGCYMCIINGHPLAPLSRLENGELCSWFKPVANPVDARRQWITGSIRPKGQLFIDKGAAKALASGKSLLAAGVTAIDGDFYKGDTVSIVDEHSHEIARGLVSYDVADAALILGLKSGDILEALGYDNGAALVHRDNLVMTS